MAGATWLHPAPLALDSVGWQSEPLFVASWGEHDVYVQSCVGDLPFAEPRVEQHKQGVEEITGQTTGEAAVQTSVKTTRSCNFALMPIRQSLAQYSEAEAGLVSRALQLSHWLKDHQYCGRCGALLVMRRHDYGMSCAACALTQYPRISPCIIVVIVSPKGILLGRNVNYPEGRYSALAGFVEAGETLEAAVHREVMEEVGVTISNLNYIGSQPWAFPHSLMVGYIATYAGGEITVDGIEIEDADWFMNDNLPDLPPPHSIARHLIELGLAQVNQQQRAEKL